MRAQDMRVRQSVRLISYAGTPAKEITDVHHVGIVTRTPLRWTGIGYVSFRKINSPEEVEWAMLPGELVPAEWPVQL